MFVVKLGDEIGFPSNVSRPTGSTKLQATIPTIENYVTKHGLIIPVCSLRGNPLTLYEHPHRPMNDGEQSYSAYLRMDHNGVFTRDEFFDSEVAKDGPKHYSLDAEALPTSGDWIISPTNQHSLFLESLETLVVAGCNKEEFTNVALERTSIGAKLSWYKIDDLINLVRDEQAKDLRILYKTDKIKFDHTKDNIIRKDALVKDSIPTFIDEEGELVEYKDALNYNFSKLREGVRPLGLRTEDGTNYYFGIDLTRLTHNFFDL